MTIMHASGAPDAYAAYGRASCTTMVPHAAAYLSHSSLVRGCRHSLMHPTNQSAHAINRSAIGQTSDFPESAGARVRQMVILMLGGWLSRVCPLSESSRWPYHVNKLIEGIGTSSMSTQPVNLFPVLRTSLFLFLPDFPGSDGHPDLRLFLSCRHPSSSLVWGFRNPDERTKEKAKLWCPLPECKCLHPNCTKSTKCTISG